MSRLKKGFTLIEVALFLVITGALFAAITIGVQNSITQQRFNDAVQSFAEFLRSAYAQTMNVQNLAGGRSEKAIYGRLITFGESEDATGKTVSEDEMRNVIYEYDIIGDIADFGTGDVLNTLALANADVIRVDNDRVQAAGIIENYLPKWSSQIEPACTETECDYSPFKGAVLIVRHPDSGTVYTYVMKGETIEINHYIGEAKNDYDGIIDELTKAENEGDTEKIATIQSDLLAYRNNNQDVNILKDALVSGKFSMSQVDFCVNPEYDTIYSMRRDVRIVAGARNASGVEVVDDDKSKCRIEE